MNSRSDSDLAPLRPLQTMAADAVHRCRQQCPAAYEALVQYDGLYLELAARLEGKEAELARCIDVGQEVLSQLNAMRERCSALSDERDGLRRDGHESEQLVAHLRDVIRTRDRQLEDLCRRQGGDGGAASMPRRSTSPQAAQGGAAAAAASVAALEARVAALRSELDRGVERILELENALEREVAAKQQAERQARSERDRAQQLLVDLTHTEDAAAALRWQLADLRALRTQDEIDLASCRVIAENILARVAAAVSGDGEVSSSTSNALASLLDNGKAVGAAEAQKAEQSDTRAPATAAQLKAALAAAFHSVAAQLPSPSAHRRQARHHSSPSGTGAARGRQELEAALLDARHRISVLEATNQELRDEAARVVAVAPLPRYAAASHSFSMVPPSSQSAVGAAAGAGAAVVGSRAGGDTSSGGGGGGGAEASSLDESRALVVELQRRELDQLQQVLQQHEALASAREGALQSLHEERAAVEAELRKALEEKEHSLQRTRAEAEASQLRAAELEKDLDAAQAVLELLPQHQREAKTQAAEAAALHSRVAELEAANEAAKRRSVRLAAELDQRADSAAAAEATVRELRRELAALHDGTQVEQQRTGDAHRALHQRADDLHAALSALVAAARRAEALVGAAQSSFVATSGARAAAGASLARAVAALLGGLLEPLTSALGAAAPLVEDSKSGEESVAARATERAVSASPPPTQQEQQLITSAAAQLEEFSNEIAVGAARVRLCEAELLRAKEQLDEHEHELAGARRRLQSAIEEQQAAQRDADKRRAEASGLQAQLREAEAAGQESSLEVKRLRSSTERLERRLMEAEQATVRAEREAQKRAAVVQEMQARIDQQAAHEEQYRDAELERLERTHSATLGELRELRETHAALTERFESKAEEAQALAVRVAQLTKHNDEMSQALSIARVEVVQFQTALLELSEDDAASRHTKEDELQRAQQTISALQKNLKHAHDASGEMAHGRQAMLTELQQLRGELSRTQASLAELEGAQVAAESLRQKLEFLKEENAILSESSATDARAIAALQRANAVLEERLHLLEARGGPVGTNTAAGSYRSVSLESSRLHA